MRILELHLYTFAELCESAKKKAIELLRNKTAEIRNEFDSQDYRNTLEKIEEMFHINVRNWEVGCCSRPFFQYHFSGDDGRWDELSDDPKFLLRYLNSITLPARAGKYYSTSGHYDENHKFHYKYRHSKVLFDDETWSLTGTWCDDAVIKAMRTANEAVRKGWTIDQFIKSMLSHFFNNWSEDLESAYSDEAVIDDITGNDYEFLSTGVPYAA